MTESERPPEESGGDPEAAVEPLPAVDPEAAVEPLPAVDPAGAVEPLPPADPAPEPLPPTAEGSTPYAPLEATDAAPAPSWPEEHVPDGYAERPHLYVAGAFAGGFVLAKLLGKLGRG